MKFKIFIPGVLFLLLSAGCATLPYAKMEGALRRGDYDQARATLSAAKKEYGSKAHLLYLFDQVSLAHYASDWTTSNQYLEKADHLIDELYTKSLSAEAASFLLNDMSLPYQGENFERVLLHVLGMVNYAGLGERDEALVEARRADERLKQYAAAVGPDKVAYKDDALARYISAFLYEGGSQQDLWDSYLDYKNADKAFDLYQQLYATPKPQRLKVDLQRMAQGLGEKDDLAQWQQRDGVQPFRPLSETRRDRAEVLVLLYDGLAPVKISKADAIPVTLSDGTQQYFQLALPYFVVRANPVPSARLVAGPHTTPFELFEDVNSIAVKDLADHRAGILVKATARALVKFQAARAVQKKAKEAGGGAELLAMLGTNLFTLLSEQADTRSWRTLPGRIWVARLTVAPGDRSLLIDLSQGGDQRVLDLGTQHFAPGEKKVLVKTLF